MKLVVWENEYSMTLESAIRRITLEGFIVRNLFELESGLWQANLHDGEKAFNFGRAPTPEVALLSALEQARHKPGVSFISNKKAEDLLETLFE